MLGHLSHQSETKGLLPLAQLDINDRRLEHRLTAIGYRPLDSLVGIHDDLHLAVRRTHFIISRHRTGCDQAKHT